MCYAMPGNTILIYLSSRYSYTKELHAEVYGSQHLRSLIYPVGLISLILIYLQFSVKKIEYKPPVKSSCLYLYCRTGR